MRGCRGESVINSYVAKKKEKVETFFEVKEIWETKRQNNFTAFFNIFMSMFQDRK